MPRITTTLAVAALLIVVSGLGYVLLGGSEVPASATEITGASEHEQQLLAEALASNDSSLCNEIQHPSTHEHCAQALAERRSESRTDEQIHADAVSSGDASMCDGITDAQGRESCRQATATALNQTDQGGST